MELNDKIRLLRETHQLTQEDMAHKLSMSSSGYAKLEQGGTNIQMSRVEQIARVFEISVLELMSLGEKKVIYCNISENSLATNSVLVGVTNDSDGIIATSKLQMTVNYQTETIELLKQEIKMLKEVIELLKEKA